MSEVLEPVKEAAPKAKASKMFKVTIHSGEDKGDKGDVFLGHNYKSLLIQRDQEVTIAEHWLDCLKHSVIETTVKDENNVVKAVKIPRYSYSVMPA